MALNHNDVELPELIINHFETLADYQAAYQGGFISGTDITFIDENIQPDWDETDSGSPAYIKNKPIISGGGSSVQSNWAQNDPSAADYIKNKPTITPVSGTNDGTNWTTITIGDTTKNIPSGGGGGGGSSTLSGLTDTTISSPSDGQILAYDSTTSKWVNTANTQGTITGINMNGSSKGTSGVVDLGTVVTAQTQLSTGNTTGSGNAVTSINVSNHQISLVKGETFATSSEFSTHVASGSHITATERTNLNSAYNTVTAHTGNTDIHVTTSDKSNWNGKQDAINDIGQIRTNAASGYSAYTGLTAHTGNTDIHVTTSDKSNWNGKQNSISDLSQIRTNAASGWSAYQTVTAHTGSTTLHLPNVTTGDTGKILQVSSAGTWQLVSPVVIYTGTGNPSQSLGKDGDIYIQTT